MRKTENLTRKELIDPQLDAVGWDVSNRNQVGIEIPVDGYDAEPWNGITDYILHRSNGEIIAVVEAKRLSRSPEVAEEQVRHYVTEIEKHQSFRPFAFMTNGQKIIFWDIGQENSRQVATFFSLDDLENLLYVRQNKIPISQLTINRLIAGRTYQQEAIQRVAERFELGYRRALVVMATGTGKTRTIMALLDLFMRGNQARKILFLADRNSLVTQALNENLKIYLPNEPNGIIKTYNIDYSKRLYVGTLHTLNNCYRKFTAGFFDLIILDECHRSIYNQFRSIVEYFDGRIVGLTATPAEFLDRNTFQTFHCHENIPTFLYTYQQAVADGYLVNYSLYQARTSFQRDGIRGADLSEEDRNLLIEQGIDPDDIDYEGTDLEKKVSNKGTLRQQWEEIMEVCHKDESGQYPCKTIVFSLTKNHAFRLAEVFREMYPQYPEMVQVIVSDMEKTDNLIERFKKDEMPRIAISVDLLDTGIDVPEVMNLVFMKPVQSEIKKQQMIGRGTRNNEACRFFNRLPNGRKDEFLIIDFWENSFGQEPVEETISQNLPVAVKIFNSRLKLLEYYLSNHQQNSDEMDRVTKDVRSQIDEIPLDVFSVQKIYPQVEKAWQDDFWYLLTRDKVDFLRTQVAPLLRFVSGLDVSACTFTNKVERLKLEILSGKVKDRTLQSIQEDISLLPNFVYEDSSKQDSLQICRSGLEKATQAELNQIIDDLADMMKNRRERPNSFLDLDLADTIASRGYITLGEGGEQIYVEEYRRRVEEKILEIIDSDPVMIAISSGQPVNDLELVSLERKLKIELGADNIQLSQSNIRKAFKLKVNSLLSFVRELLELEMIPDYDDIVTRNFEEYISQGLFNGDQIRFLRAVQKVFLQKRKLELADLYEAPLDNFGDDAVEKWFNEEQVNDLINFIDRFAA